MWSKRRNDKLALERTQVDSASEDGSVPLKTQTNLTKEFDSASSPILRVTKMPSADFEDGEVVKR